MNRLTRFLPLASALAAVGMFVLATQLYSGGTVFTPSESHYLWELNTISETMMTSGYDGQIIILPRIFTSIAIFILLAVVGTHLLTHRHKSTVSIAATIIALISISGAVVLPADLYSTLHNSSFAAGILAVTISTCALCARSWWQSDFYGLLVLIPTSLVLIAYCVFLILFPSPSISIEVRTTHAVLQKIIIGIVLISTIIPPLLQRHESNT